MEKGHRRKFLLASSALLAAPLVSFAQPSQNVRRLGILSATNVDRKFLDTYLFPRLRELGWTEGGNLEIEIRGAEGHNDRLPQLALELVQQKVDCCPNRTILAAYPKRR